jgi:hypothetical protein
MSKAILEFDLSDPDDQQQFNRVVNADKMAFALFEITRNSRKGLMWDVERKISELKDNKDEFSHFDAVDMVYDMIFEKLSENGIDIDDLV